MGFSSEFPGCFSCLSFLWSSSWRKFYPLGEAHNFFQHGTVLGCTWLLSCKVMRKDQKFLDCQQKNLSNLIKAFLFGVLAEPCICRPVPHIAWPWRFQCCDTGIATSILPLHCQICQMLGCWHFGVCSLKAAQFAWKFCICRFSRKKCTVTVHFRDKTHDILLTLSWHPQKNQGPKPISMSGCLMLFLGREGQLWSCFPSCFRKPMASGNGTYGTSHHWILKQKPTAGETSNRSVFKLPTYPLWSVLRKWWPFACSWSGC